ncbi:glycine/D-amino acid oxidase-like deaminating enzyme/nitrite reductase/ring-hydroxylating ferredoxin subunit [Paenibacillus phyllosphaerae]|uniref:Glycine/D-amino acid oxidase-like deaminating enzyme/nitrite reductase/ring-hydroxylating ferredoxin subunit n=1 Tax=Paenibacillus phyllosphaerae TaxID=274593 RepID=A0A7W5AYU9_9BACL|nr:FAD-dependent oxidoreductase [Paenibacillus phyllosphaerae]MBB3111277.1 glycine/D-amino acid oxidase-like deaminating enzyme/nitrite reductase/ring-hydroxylating ferredoxin subunit [Paenibacillus phyllosphaerae]
MSMNSETLKQLPDMPKSYWRESSSVPDCGALDNNLTVDVAIVGGGITGITTAYLLSKAGVKVALVEADSLFSGTTGHTTAKLTAQHDLIFDQLIHSHSEEAARQYYEANRDGMNLLKQIIDEHGIDCGYVEEDAYVYAQSVDSLKKLNKEADAYAKLGIPGGFVESIPLQLPNHGAVVMKGQARFHPLRYLSALASLITQAGGLLYDRTAVSRIDEDGPRPTVVTERGLRIMADHVLICSHFPFYDKHGLYFARLHAERSYVLAVRSQMTYPGGMYLSAEDPKRSLRLAEVEDGQQLLLVGGGNHKTGQGICTIDYYESLRDFALKHFQVESIPYRWSAQDLTTLDKLPYIGQLTEDKPRILVATGFAKWGMSNSQAAAQLLTDYVLERSNPYQELFTPQRFHLIPDVKNAIVQNADVFKNLVAGKVELVRQSPDDLANGEGGVVTIGGKRAGAYRDDEGALHMVDTTCTHMGCEVEWNDGERSWDCPCHGSRFSYKGEVMEGPAHEPLQRVYR